MIMMLVGYVAVALLIVAFLPTECPGCGETKWQEEPGLRECANCGVLMEPSRGRWRYRVSATRYPMPGWRGLLFRPDEVLPPPRRPVDEIPPTNMRR